MGLSNRYFIRGEDLVTREVAGETIIVPIKSNVGDLSSIFTLNEIGTVIWELVDGRKSVSDIVNAVCETYEVKREVAEKDTLEFLNTLKEAGLLRLSDEL